MNNKTAPFLKALMVFLITSSPLAAVLVCGATEDANPQITSWLVSPSGAYAKLFESSAAKSAGNYVTTWSRGQGRQNTPTYAGVMQVSASEEWIYLRSTGLGYHAMGPWYLNEGQTQDFPNFPANTDVLFRIPRNPAVATDNTLTQPGAIGYFVDGVALFDSRDTFSYSNSRSTDGSPVNGVRGDGVWNRDAYINESVTFDPAFAHQAGAMYHYHANAPALRYLLGDNVEYNASTRTYSERSTAPTQHSPILAWVADGYPLYGPYGYSDPMDDTSGVRRMISGFVKRDGSNGTTNLNTTGRTTLANWAAEAQGSGTSLASNRHGPNVSSTYPLGHYIEDYDYLGDLGYTHGTDFDLDEFNGRFCVTPEYPNGTYAYFMSIESDGTPKYPYNLGRQFYGVPSGGNVNSISETVTEHRKGGSALPISVTAVGIDSQVILSWTSVDGATYKIEYSPDGSTFIQLASGITSAGLTTSFETTTIAQQYRVTVTALASYDTGGTGGVSGLYSSGDATYAVGSTGAARLVNLSTRVEVGGTAGTPVAGFVIDGTEPRETIIRAVGPTLASLGLAGTLSNPQISLLSNGTTLVINDDWSATHSSSFSEVGAFDLVPNSRDAAIVSTLQPGSYTTPVGYGTSSGIVLLEVYDEVSDGESELVNASTRAYVGTGDKVLIPGFVVSGEDSLTLLLRAVGPGLDQFGVEGTLADPQITLYQDTNELATNDNWNQASNAADIATATNNAGAFALGPDSTDAAMMVTLSEGAYTATINGADSSTGTVLFELYVIR